MKWNLGFETEFPISISTHKLLSIGALKKNSICSTIKEKHHKTVQKYSNRRIVPVDVKLP